jgi:uncharacterized membrane protein YkoI
MKRLLLAMVMVAFATTAFADDDAADARKALDAAKVSMNDAIAAAKKEVPDGRVVEVELDWENGAARYEVELLVGDAWKEVLIDGATGKVQKVETDVKPDDADDKRDIADTRKALDAAKQTFEQAQAALAKEHKDAKPVKIELEYRSGKADYEVVVLSAEKLTKFYVDAVEGKVTK